MALKFHTVAMFVTLAHKNVSYKSVGMFMIYLQTKQNTPRSNATLVITMKPDDKCGFYAAVMLFYTVQKQLL